jgi:hypothetical protein
VNRRLGAAAAAAAVVVWLLVSGLDLDPHPALTDLPVYENAARAVTGGDVPYRDLPFEYPPLALGLVTFARILPLPYASAFSLLMLVALCATALGVVATARALGLPPWRQAAAGAAVAMLPVLLGDFVASRFDLALAALLAWTVWAAVTGRWRTAWALFAIAVALKLVPLVLAPLLVLWHRRSRGTTRAVGSLAAALAAVAATMLPFIVLAPGGVWHMFEYHIDRPLQIESTGSAYLLGLHALADTPLRVETSFGSQNLVGSGPATIAAISTVLAILGIAAVCITVVLLLRGTPPGRENGIMIAGVAATMALAVTAGKVLSPQFMIWLVPLTLILGGRFGIRAFAATVCVLVATRLYFPGSYWDLVGLRTTPIALLVLRDALLVALVAFAWPRPAAADAPLGVSAPPA